MSPLGIAATNGEFEPNIFQPLKSLNKIIVGLGLRSKFGKVLLIFSPLR